MACGAIALILPYRVRFRSACLCLYRFASACSLSVPDPEYGDGDAIEIGPIASTERACLEPEGVMEQESLYLAALQTAATYSVRGETMEMRTEDGALVANFARS